MPLHRIKLYRSEDCIGNWLAYSANYLYACEGEPTVTVDIEAPTAQKAKGKAISAANNGFVGCTVISVSRGVGGIWDANQFPILKDVHPSPIPIVSDKDLLDWFEENAQAATLHTFPIADTGDYDANWIVTGDRTSHPGVIKEIGYGDTLRRAIRDAMLDEDDPRKKDYVPLGHRCEPPLGTGSEVIDYLRSLQEGERVVECGQSGLHGRQGTVYISCKQ